MTTTKQLEHIKTIERIKTQRQWTPAEQHQVTKHIQKHIGEIYEAARSLALKD